MDVQYVMSSPPVTVPVMASVQDTAQHMKYSGAGAVFVVDDDNRLLGVVTDRDLVTRILTPGRSGQVRVEAVMTKNPVAVAASDDILAAYRAMRSQRVRRLPVVSGNRIVGVVTFDDLFWLSAQGLADLQGVVDRARESVAPFRAA